jgi:hypothetical protein
MTRSAPVPTGRGSVIRATELVIAFSLLAILYLSVARRNFGEVG